MARISAEGEVLLCTKRQPWPSVLRKELDASTQSCVVLVQRLDDGENELSTLKMGSVGTRGYGRVLENPMHL